MWRPSSFLASLSCVSDAVSGACHLKIPCIEMRFIDIINLLGVLTSPYPGAHNMFSNHCPDSIPVNLPKNTTIYLEDVSRPTASRLTGRSGARQSGLPGPQGH